MGLDNRDYARDGFHSNRGGWGPANSSGSFFEWEVWKKLIAINVIVFLLQIFFTRPATVEDFAIEGNFNFSLTSIPQGGSESETPWATDETLLDGPDEFEEPPLSEEELQELRQLERQFYRSLPGQRVSIVQEWCELDSEKVLKGQVWRVVTAGFLHNRFGIWHLVFNMLFLYWFGSRLESRYGSAEFTAFYFVSLICSSLAYIALDLYTGSLIPAIGASGAVWGVVALYAMLYPFDQIRIYFLVPIPIWLMALLYFAYDLHPVLLALSGEAYFTGVGHAAHVGGAVFGFLYYKCGWRLMPLVDRIRGNRKPFANSRRRISVPDHHDDEPAILQMPNQFKRLHVEDEQQLDEILGKLSSKGQAALTEEEKAFLEDASKKLKG